METQAVDHALAALAREAIENHDEWDSLHTLMVIYKEGDGIRVDTMAAIDPAFNPDLYPVLIEAVTRTCAAVGPPYALLLQIEAFGALMPDDDAPAWERAQM